MSMFHELMMRKKEEIMYATIKGSLTENDGVFSGFAYNNYLATQEEFDCSKDFEIITKVNTGNQSVTQFKVLCRNTFGANPSTSIGFAIGIENGKIKAFFRNSDGVVIGRGTGNNGITTFADNVDCFFRFSQKKYNNTYTIQIESSLDNVNWVKEVNLTSSLSLRNSGQGIAFGGGSFSSTSQYWAGSIDLPNSYIKLGSTKYNLQAVVGYTIVGSPTITDGVVSGFSADDYLKLPSIPANSYSKIEVHTKIKLSNVVQGNIITTNDIRYQGIYVRSNLRIGSFMQLGSTGYPLVYDVNLITNQDYIIDFIIDTENLYTKLVVNNSDKSATITVTNKRELLYLLGYGINGALNGEIYLKDTWIKKDGKLWFNGQQA